MKCMSCHADIPPAWVHSLNSNICPGCGGEIMDSVTKTMLGDLREAMNEMPNNPEGLAGWILSHYKLVKIGSAEPTEFHTRTTSQAMVSQGPMPAESGPLGPINIKMGPHGKSGQTANLVNKFLARTGVKPVETSRMQEMVQQIKSGASGEAWDPDVLSAMDDEDDVHVPGSHVTDADPEIVNALASAVPELPTNPELQIREMKRQQLQVEMRSGGAGKIRRSG